MRKIRQLPGHGVMAIVSVDYRLVQRAA